MKSILLSISPKWCELIASGKKTIEVRKTKPKIPTPFKVYIYCTNDFSNYATKSRCNKFWVGEPINDMSKGRYLGNGKVIGEFACDRVFEYEYFKEDYEVGAFEGYAITDCTELSINDCLEKKELVKYGKGKPIYGWHISELLIYEQPKELNEFINDCCDYFSTSIKDCTCREQCCYQYREITCDGQDIVMCANPEMCIKRITRPPQSWCYVEELNFNE